MKWHERHGPTIEMALFFLIVMGMLGLCLMLLLVPVTSYGASCLTIDVPPQAVIHVVDGDTFAVFNLLPPGYVKIRVKDAHAPERGQPGFTEAKQFTTDWLAQGSFRLSTCGKQTFERIVGTVERNGQTLTGALIDAGYSK